MTAKPFSASFFADCLGQNVDRIGGQGTGRAKHGHRWTYLGKFVKAFDQLGHNSKNAPGVFDAHLIDDITGIRHITLGLPGISKYNYARLLLFSLKKKRSIAWASLI